MLLDTFPTESECRCLMEENAFFFFFFLFNVFSDNYHFYRSKLVDEEMVMLPCK